MIKSVLVSQAADKNSDVPASMIRKAVDIIFDEMASALERGERVEIRGFGTFSPKLRQARSGRNPRTGEKVDVEAKFVPFFKPGKLLRDRLNGGD